mgnify:CR=1 FL=1
MVAENLEKAKIMNVFDLLQMNLHIPNYQRPYKWKIKNISTLLGDIEQALQDSNQYKDFKYRIGTVILHQDKNRYDMVDGQQRCISLSLLLYCLNGRSNSLLKEKSLSDISKTNVCQNYLYIHNWISNNNNKDKILNALKNIFEFVVLIVDKETEAFQLFDSQNTRGKMLNPHDLLKAYHLREMNNLPFEMHNAVTKWEAIKPAEIHELFNNYLFPILKWSRKEKVSAFTAKEIDYYKGTHAHSSYTYAERVAKSMNIFQITEPFTAGKCFFEMTDYYVKLLNYVRNEAYKQIGISKLDVIDINEYSTGFKYARTLFECATLCYYDKFHNWNKQAIKNLFSWAFMLRVDLEVLSFFSINAYATSNNMDTRYTNSIPIFSIIRNAINHKEIADLTIKIKRDSDTAQKDTWDDLYDQIKELNGYGTK